MIVRLFRRAAPALAMFWQNAETALLHAWVLPTGDGWWVGFAVEAGSTIIVDQEKTIKFADKHGIVIMAI